MKENNIKNLENLKIQLNDIRQEKLKGHIIIRSRAQHINKGEKPTKYFCGLEQQNSLNKRLNELELDNETIITEQNAILKETEIFYKKNFKISLKISLRLFIWKHILAVIWLPN